jgi:hypothetical protein
VSGDEWVVIGGVLLGNVPLKVVVAGVGLATFRHGARKRHGLVSVFMSLEIVLPSKALGAKKRLLASWSKRGGRKDIPHGAEERSAVKVLVPYMVVEVIDPLARVVRSRRVVEWAGLLVGPLDATVSNEAPPAPFVDLYEVSSDKRGWECTVGVLAEVVEDGLCGGDLQRGEPSRDKARSSSRRPRHSARRSSACASTRNVTHVLRKRGARVRSV